MQQAETRRAREATVKVMVVIEIVDIFQYKFLRSVTKLLETYVKGVGKCLTTGEGQQTLLGKHGYLVYFPFPVESVQ